jgi:predicted anti-sigma-YlaC factor YlaD
VKLVDWKWLLMARLVRWLLLLLHVVIVVVVVVDGIVEVHRDVDYVEVY